MKVLNLNDIIKVKLTDLGKDIYFHQYDYFIKKGVEIDRSYPIEDENGFCTFQLWHFIQIYGTHIGMELPNVVEDLNFYIEENDLDEVII